MSKPTAKYIQGDIGKQIFKDSIPMVLGIGAAIAFNVVDTIFIAMLGVDELAAITFTFPIVYLIMGIAMGLGTGISVVLSQKIGESKQNDIKIITTSSLILGLILVALLVIVGFVFFNEIFTLMGASEKLLPHIKDYMLIWLSGVIFLVIPMMSNYAIRAQGDTRTPSMIMMVAVIVNLALDPILIFGLGPIPSLGIKGAAIATVIARFMTMLISLYVLTRRYEMLNIKLLTKSNIWQSWREIMHVGLPASVTSILVPLGFAVVIDFISEFGESAIAGFGAASRVEALVLTVFMALASVLSPFIGQNIGAKNYDRILKGIKSSFKFSALWGILTIGFFQLFSTYIAEFIKDDAKVIEVIVMYFAIFPLAVAFKGMIMIITSTLNVLKKPILSSAVTIINTFVLFIPLAMLASEHYGLIGIFWTSFLTSILGFTISFFLLKSNLNKLKLSLP